MSEKTKHHHHHHHHHRSASVNEQLRRRRRKLAARLLPLAALLLIVAVLLTIRFTADRETLEGYVPTERENPAPERETIMTIDGRKYVLREGLETFLVLGLDKFEEEITDDSAYVSGQQCDFLVLLVLDWLNGNNYAIQINRDTIAPVTVYSVDGEVIRTENTQICLSHTYGGEGLLSCRNAADSVSKLLCGVPVDHVFSMTMDAVPEVNDLAGGVELTLDEDLTAIDPSLKKGETVTLKGRLALDFVRARMSVGQGTNLERMGRQRLYLSGLYRACAGRMEEDSGFALRVLKKIAPYTVSDCTAGQLSVALDRLSEHEVDLRVIEGYADEEDGYAIFIPDNAALRLLVAELFCSPED